MNRLSALFALLVLLLIDLCEANAQANLRAGVEGSGKPYTISVGLRQEYDDNIFTSSNNEQGSWKTIVNPSVVFNYPMENTSISFGADFGLIFYWDRPGDDFDYNQLFTGRVSHNFSDRFQLDLREQFRFAQEAEGRSGTAIQRFLGDGFSNSASIDGTAKWTDRFSTVTGYSNTLDRYDDSSINLVNDQMTHGVRQDFQFSVLPTTTAVAAFNYSTTDYTDGNILGTRDFDVYRGTVGADHYILTNWLITGRFGGEYVDRANTALSDGANPYVDLSTAWTYLPGSRLRASYNYATNLTDDAQSGTSTGHTLALEIQHAITPKLTATGSVRGQFQSLDRSSALGAVNSDAIDETSYTTSLGLSYTITNYLSANVGYTLSGVDSDDASREYWRNQIYFGITGKY
ncbi:MAG: outer membrane beta-barrel protein [Candidatus Methylacidiphilales bacterium]|nr:outer membrane beta-barrel protein [Candidatus Methylacidiphilales bacterium]